ncbi:hypothetical protein K3495_g5546 [Podosphaera aphanis]|nr:hypothetical protein K3495_g5546 [Podosphaera aphanis]
MVAVECLEGAPADGSSEAPKEWTRLELQLSPALKNNWPAFAQRLRDRYLSPSVIHMRIQLRQTLKQDAKTETSSPRQVWGEDFFKGLIDPLQGKLLGTPYIDITNYDVVTQLALQFESGYRMQKELKSFGTQVGNKSKVFSIATTEPKKSFPLP